MKSELTRRDAIALMAGWMAQVPSAARASERADIPGVPSLGDIAAKRGLLFGSAIDMDTLANGDQAALYVHHARILTADNVMKFGSLRPEEGPANFASADRLVNFAALHKIPLRGHNLIWNDWVPEWVSKLSAARITYWLDRHIDEVVGRYAGRLHSWDVVNEPLFPMHQNPGGFRSGPWYSAMGKSHVIRALKRARAADPTGKIFINEAGPEWENPWGPVEPYREGLLRLVEEVQDAGIKLDGVGLECHWFPQFTFNSVRFTDYLHALAARGVTLYVTELDVNDGGLTGTEAERDAKVAARYAQIITAALKEPKVEGIITWQLSDNASWLMGEPKLWGPNAQRPRPLPFDHSFRPKPAYHAVAKSLSAS